MFINGNEYNAILSELNAVRQVLFTRLYCDPTCIATLTELIKHYIDTLDVSFDPNRYTFIVNVKKTSMKKTYGSKFSHDAVFYYDFIDKIFREFLYIYKANVIDAFMDCKFHTAPETAFYRITDELPTPTLANLCQVTCLPDKILVIKL